MIEILSLTLLVIKWLTAIILGTTIVFLLCGIGSVCFELIEDFFDKIQEKFLKNNE